MIRLIDLDVPALTALEDGDVVSPSLSLGTVLPRELVEDGHPWGLFAERRGQPGAQGWTTHLVVEDGVVVGHAGFHLPPDADGAVEIGYTVLRPHRGRGVAKAAVAALVEQARVSGRVRVVQGCTAPSNLASQAVLRANEFVYRRDVMDDEDGRELLFERRL